MVETTFNFVAVSGASLAPFPLSSTVLVPAIVALTVSGLTLLVTYLTSDRRAKFDAAFEAAKYREKWLSTVREEVVQFCVLATKMSVQGEKKGKDVEDFISMRVRLQLSVPNSNSHYGEFLRQLDELYESGLSVPALDNAKSLKKMTSVSDKIFKDEWDDIQQLLATGIKKKKYNAKNQ